jgi:predicted glycosyltransferase
VTGPLLSPRRRARIARTAATIPHLQVLEFVPDLEDRIAASDGVVAMAGYNTTAEILAAGVPAMVFPRREPRLEQWIRAERLAAHSDIRVGLVEDVTDSQLADWTAHCMSRPPPLPIGLRLDGAEGAARVLRRCAQPNHLEFETVAP